MTAHDVEPIPPGSRPTCACLRCSCPDLVSCPSRHRCAQLAHDERRWTWTRDPDFYAGPVPVVSTDERARWAGNDPWICTDEERRIVVDIDERLKIRADRELVSCSCGHSYVPGWFGHRCPRCGRVFEGV